MSDIVPLCDSCCRKASHLCADACQDGPVVHCSNHGRPISVTKPPNGPAAACTLCLGHPAPGESCRLCGGQGEPFLATEADSGWSKPHEFQLADPEVERLRAELEWVRTHIREALIVADVTSPALALMLREALQ